MITSPLQLETSFVSKLEILADPGFRPEDEFAAEVRTAVGLDSDKDEPGLWHLTLKVILGPQPDERAPYSGELHVHGFFRFLDDEVPLERAAQLVAVNGASMLYSSAREYLLLVTSRGPWPAVQLPTVSFLDLKPEKVNHETSDAEE